MTQVKFYRVETLPETGEVGSLYFVYGSGGVQSMLYICVENGLFELYTPDLSSVAKQGDNTEATNTAILAEIKAINDLKNTYSARFEQNQDGDNTYTMVLPLVAGIENGTIII